MIVNVEILIATRWCVILYRRAWLNVLESLIDRLRAGSSSKNNTPHTHSSYAKTDPAYARYNLISSETATENERTHKCTI